MRCILIIQMRIMIYFVHFMFGGNLKKMAFFNVIGSQILFNFQKIEYFRFCSRVDQKGMAILTHFCTSSPSSIFSGTILGYLTPNNRLLRPFSLGNQRVNSFYFINLKNQIHFYCLELLTAIKGNKKIK